MMLDLGLIAKRPRIVRRAGGRGQPALPRLPEQLAVRAGARAADAGLGHPDRQPGLDPTRHRALQRFDGIVEQATETSWPTPAARADRTGMFNCPHTAVALAALEKLDRPGRGRGRDRVVVVSTANGLKFSEFKTGYHTNTLKRRDAPARQPAGGAAERLRRGAAGDRSPARRWEAGNVARTPPLPPPRTARSLEVRRRVARRRRTDREGGGADRHAQRVRWSSCRRRWPASPTCCSKARASHRRNATTRRGCRRRSCAVIARWRARCCQRARARKLLATIDSAAPRIPRACAAVGLLGHLEPRASDRARLARRADVGADSRGGARSPGRPARRLRRRARRGRDRRASRRRGAQPARRRGAARAAAAAASRRGTIAVVPGFIGRAPDGSVTTLGRGGTDLSATLLGARCCAQPRRAVEGRAGHPDRRPAARARRAADSAAAPSRGGRSRALRREGAAPARADPDRRHARRDARALVPRSRRAGHRGVGAPLAARPIRSRRSPSSATRRSSPSPARAWPASTASPRARSRRSKPSGCRSRRSSRRRPRARSASRCRNRSGPRRQEHPADVQRRADERPDRQRHGEAGHGGGRRRRRRHGRHARHRRARVFGARRGASTSSRSRRGRRSATSRSRSTATMPPRRRGACTRHSSCRRSAADGRGDAWTDVVLLGFGRVGRALADQIAARPQSAAGARGRPARPLGLHLRAARDLTPPSARPRAARRMAARCSRRSAAARRTRPKR